MPSQIRPARARACLRLCLAAAALLARHLGEALLQVDDLDAGRFFGWQSLLTLVDLRSQGLTKVVTRGPPCAHAA